MTIGTKLHVVLAFFLTATIAAQDFQGVATYKSHRKFDFKMEGENHNAEMQASIEAQLKKQFQQEYTLSFTKEASIYKKVEQLDKPNPMANSGIVIQVSDGNDLLYKNIKDNRFTNKRELYGKLFLIKDQLEAPKWELGTETKNIGEYTCFKASYTEEVENQTLSSDGEMVKEMEERTVVAWYTPQIPISNGPQNFQGLPGLILEINDGKLTLVCSKIVMNPAEAIELSEPVKGKVVTQAEFDEIAEKKAKEMMDRYRSSSGDGERHMIRIRG